MGLLTTHIDFTADAAGTKQLKLSEENEWIRASQTDLKHFEPLYKRYFQPIYEFIYRRCDDADACLDITSTVFEKAMLNIGKYKIQGWPFGSWLYRIASSEIGNYYRIINKERKVWVKTEGLEDIAQELDSSGFEQEKLAAVLKAMEVLKPEDIELLVMRYFEKRQISEIAVITDTTEPNARVRLHRVIERLRKAIEKENRL